MEIADQHLTLYTTDVEKQSGKYVLQVPERELDLGTVDDGDVYRIAILPHEESEDASCATQQHQNPSAQRQPLDLDQAPNPPVQEGDKRVVEIESTGEEGDGVAKVDRGYVVMVSDASEGDIVRIELQTVRQNVGFADVVEYVE